MIARLKPSRSMHRIATFAALALSSTLFAQDGQWLTYSGSFSSHRFSPLAQLTPSNVGRLKPVWVYQPAGVGSVEATPIVADGVMYTTSGPTNVAALDLKSGKPLWEWNRPIAATVLNLGFPRVNRGVAILDGTVYVGTLDGYLVALDAKSGAERWSTQVGDNPTGHAITAAPLAVDGKIIVGISGGEAGNPRVPRRLRREDRQAGLALLDRCRRRANPGANRGPATAGSTAAARRG
jgi:glucose dehydrogenase